MQITFELKPYTVKETHFSNLNDAISCTMGNYGGMCMSSKYGTYREPISRYDRNVCYVYSVETFKRGRGKYRTKPKQIFRIFKFTKEFLEAGNLRLEQKRRYFRLVSNVSRANKRYSL